MNIPSSLALPHRVQAHMRSLGHWGGVPPKGVRDLRVFLFRIPDTRKAALFVHMVHDVAFYHRLKNKKGQSITD